MEQYTDGVTHVRSALVIGRSGLPVEGYPDDLMELLSVIRITCSLFGRRLDGLVLASSESDRGSGRQQEGCADDPMESPLAIGYHWGISSIDWKLYRWPMEQRPTAGARSNRDPKYEHSDTKDEPVGVYEYEPTRLPDACGILCFSRMQTGG